MDIWFGWRTLPINELGYPVDKVTRWEAECFILFTRIIYVGKVKPYNEIKH